MRKLLTCVLGAVLLVMASCAEMSPVYAGGSDNPPPTLPRLATDVGPDAPGAQYMHMPDDGVMIILSPGVVEACTAEGGCSIMSKQFVEDSKLNAILSNCGHQL